jgi:hypothetical protein
MTNPENKPLKGRIKVGTKIHQDRHFLTWPDCLPAKNSDLVNPNMVFDLHWEKTSGGGYWNCTAPGFGVLENNQYGNGGIFVHDKDGVEIVEEQHPVPLTKEEVEAYIVKTQWFRFPDTLHTVCCLTLKNGYTVIGENVCAHEEYFDQEYAKVDSKEKALEKVWGLVAFVKKSCS